MDIEYQPSNPSLLKQKHSLAKICKQKLFHPTTKKIRKLSDSSVTTQASFSQQDISQSSQFSFILATFREASSCGQFLKKHDILPTHYARMIDWMTQINDVFKSSAQTLFLSIDIMQRYFAKTFKVQNSRDLHLIGITSQFIASKFEDVFPLDIFQVKFKLANQEFSIQEIQDKEIEILEVLDYQLNTPNLYNYCCAIISEINLQDLVGSRIAELINDAISLVSLMCQCDYKILQQNEMNELVGAIISTAIKIVSIKVQILDIYLEKLMVKVQQITGGGSKNCVSSVQVLAKNFTNIHLGMQYVERFGRNLICALREMKKEEMLSNMGL